MKLKSALQDLRETTLGAVSGLLAKLAYLASLRRPEGVYRHWGMSLVHGEESSERAMKAAHTELTSKPCVNSSMGCFLHPTTRSRPAILIQFWLRFRTWRRTKSLPLRQLHRDSHNLADNLGLLGMAQNPHWNW